MGEQRNLTAENVDELKEKLEEMQETNPDLEYRFFEQTEEQAGNAEESKDESRAEFVTLGTLYDKIEDLDRKKVG